MLTRTLGRSGIPAQAALGWIWAHSERTIPIPGFKTVAQVAENVAAMRLGPLITGQMEQIDILLERAPAYRN
jgi:aryl-alcohol dehydrogenase-like predicted oxidoreductase